MKEINVYIETCRDDIDLPTYANPSDAGMDIRAAEDIIISPMETKIIPTGIKVAIPEGYEIQVRPRSGCSFKTPLRISNSPGTIDSGFRDEIGIIVTNTSVCNQNEVFTINTKGNQQGSYQINKGDRLAQLVLQEVPRINWTQVNSVKDIGTDRGGGFGHTGTN